MLNKNRYGLMHYFFFAFFLVVASALQPHGFGYFTIIHVPGSTRIPIGQLYECSAADECISGTVYSAACSRQKIEALARGTVNCHVKLWFDDMRTTDIICSPTQEFFVAASRQWMPAHKLKVGDVCWARHKKMCALKRIEFVTKPLLVYALEVRHTHTFFVGRSAIITHNMAIPIDCFLNLSVAFGAGAAAGGSTGSWFGPIGIGVGVVCGGLIGLAIDAANKDNNKKGADFKMTFNPSQLEGFLNRTFSNSATATKEETEKKPKAEKEPEKGEKEEGKKEEPKKEKPDGGSGGAQAPGKPTKDDGFIPPKRWNGDKVRNPNGAGFGWPDENGAVWIPSGPKGHGGPHWDVQYPGGAYDNIVPGGGVRGKK